MRADVYSFGMITAYMLTGNKPWKGRRTFSINDARHYGLGGENMIELPASLAGDLLPIITRCYHANRFERPSLQDLLNEYFQSKRICIKIMLRRRERRSGWTKKRWEKKGSV